MTDTLTTTNNYNDLLTDLKSIIAQGQASAISAVNKIRLQTYHDMGKRMTQVQDRLQGKEADDFVARLSADLALDKTLLYRIGQFYRTWKEGIPAVSGNYLSWAHHIVLLSIKDKDERDFYLEEATTKAWSRSALRKAVQKDYFETIKINPQADPTAELKRDPNPLHVYKAVLETVVDGDTLLTRIDLGFAVWVEQRIRFRGINTAELVKNGVAIADAQDRAARARTYVQDKLKDIPFLVIKTYKTDLYGRYVADVFYHPTLLKKEAVATEGFFLNEELLAAGLADPAS